MLLEGKAAVISGGASPRGIGLTTARLFAQHGATVEVAEIDPERAAALAGTAHAEVVDVRDGEQVRAWAADVLVSVVRSGVVIRAGSVAMLQRDSQMRRPATSAEQADSDARLDEGGIHGS